MALAPNLWWLFVGRVVSGITAASIATSCAYIADVPPAHQRAARFGLLGVAFGAGFVLGPALGGLAGAIDPRLPFWIAGVLSLVNGLYGVFVLPESLPRELRSRFEWRRANPLGSFALLRSRPQLVGLAAVDFLGHLAHASLPNIGVLYMMYRYGWDERAVGFTMAGVGICAMVVQGALIGPAVARFGERVALIAGLAFGVAGFAVFGLAATGTVFWAGIPLLALWGLASAAALGLMSHVVGPTEQGQLQGANASIMGIAKPARARPVRANLGILDRQRLVAHAGRGVPARGADPGAGDGRRVARYRRQHDLIIGVSSGECSTRSDMKHGRAP